MKLSDLYRKGATFQMSANWEKPEDSQWDFNGKYSKHDQAQPSTLQYAQYDSGATNLEPVSTGEAEDGGMDPLSFRNDMSDDDYSEVHDETEAGTAVSLNIMPELRVVKHRRQDSGHTETPTRSRQKSRGKHWKGLPNRSGNQLTPPTKPRNRKFMGIPDNKGPGI